MTKELFPALDWLVLVCLVVFAGERLYLLDWYSPNSRSFRLGMLCQALLALFAAVLHAIRMATG
ncbi:MAG: hypothetical protein N3E40_00175 [Dehalococcoidia bacterium]|nr:hypothetical protein [Dehalococcoidia bacterium]